MSSWSLQEESQEILKGHNGTTPRVCTFGKEFTTLPYYFSISIFHCHLHPLSFFIPFLASNCVVLLSFHPSNLSISYSLQDSSQNHKHNSAKTQHLATCTKSPKKLSKISIKHLSKTIQPYPFTTTTTFLFFTQSS